MFPNLEMKCEKDRVYWSSDFYCFSSFSPLLYHNYSSTGKVEDNLCKKWRMYHKKGYIMSRFSVGYWYLFQVSILFDTSFRYLVEEPILFDTSLRYRFWVSIPFLTPRYRYQRYLTSLPHAGQVPVFAILNFFLW